MSVLRLNCSFYASFSFNLQNPIRFSFDFRIPSVIWTARTDTYLVTPNTKNSCGPKLCLIGVTRPLPTDWWGCFPVQWMIGCLTPTWCWCRADGHCSFSLSVNQPHIRSFVLDSSVLVGMDYQFCSCDFLLCLFFS